jgi:hypothetical protein
MNLGHWKARLGYGLFHAGCQLIGWGARLLPSIAGWNANVQFTDGTIHSNAEVLDDVHWRGQLHAGGIVQPLRSAPILLEPGEEVRPLDELEGGRG